MVGRHVQASERGSRAARRREKRGDMVVVVLVLVVLACRVGVGGIDGLGL